MDKEELARINRVCETCLAKINGARLDSLLHMIESIAKAHANENRGIILLEVLEDGIMLSSVNVDEAHAAELVGATAISMQADLMRGAPPKEMFN